MQQDSMKDPLVGCKEAEALQIAEGGLVDENGRMSHSILQEVQRVYGDLTEMS